MSITDFLETTAEKTSKVLKRVHNSKSNLKIGLDQYIDSSMFWTTMNGLGVVGTNWIADKVSHQINSFEGAAILGVYVASAGLAAYTNKKLIVPISKQIKDFHNKKFAVGDKTRTAYSLARTGLQTGLIFGLASYMNFTTAVNNISYDVQRSVKGAIHGLERGHTKIPEQIVIPDENIVDPIIPYAPTKNNGGPMIAGELAGRNMGQDKLQSLYTGIEGIVPDVVNVDFQAQLQKLWNIKGNKFKGDWVFKIAGENMIAEYKEHKPTTITLDEYIKKHDSVMKKINNSLDWNKVGKLTNLNSDQLDLLRDISESLNGKDILCYGLTELMPSKTDGHLNIAIMDFLLRNAGREYVEAIPALADPYTSFGPYQPTQFAVFDDGKRREGASLLSLALPEEMRIPGSVMNIRGDQHITTAHLFGIYNLSRMINNLSRVEYDVLENNWTDHKDDLIKYIATAHHLPAKARKAARNWLANGAKLDYSVSCSSRIRGYADKTGENYSAIYGIKPKPKKQKRVSQPLFTDLPGTNSDGLEVFRYVVKSKDNLSVIAEKFNEWDLKQGDIFDSVGYLNVVTSKGSDLGHIYPNDRVYVKARKKPNA